MLLANREGEIEVPWRAIGCEAQGATECGLGVGRAAKLAQNVTEIIVGIGETRGEPRGLAQFGFGGGVLIRGQQGVAQSVMRMGVARLQAHGFAVRSGRLRQMAGGLEGVTEIDARFDRTRGHSDGLLQGW